MHRGILGLLWKQRGRRLRLIDEYWIEESIMRQAFDMEGIIGVVFGYFVQNESRVLTIESC